MYMSVRRLFTPVEFLYALQQKITITLGKFMLHTSVVQIHAHGAQNLRHASFLRIYLMLFVCYSR